MTTKAELRKMCDATLEDSADDYTADRLAFENAANPHRVRELLDEIEDYRDFISKFADRPFDMERALACKVLEKYKE